ncbi:hypothetical protein, partial [uncultured Paenibacillus sp.]|uniref:hypothetical protein n=1 Tax=uncultured Paenibacillus sp. TaxID=227322 RepID=UPI0028D75A6D
GFVCYCLFIATEIYFQDRKITVKQENANDWAKFILIHVFSTSSTFNASCGTVLSLLEYSC